MSTSTAQNGGGGHGAGATITEEGDGISVASAAVAPPMQRSAGALLSDMPGGMAEVLNQLDAARQILHTGMWALTSIPRHAA